jgi:hypothetical protein
MIGFSNAAPGSVDWLTSETVKHMVYGILSSTSPKELLHFERLYIVENCDFPKNERVLSDLYRDCGCFGEVRRIVEKYGDDRTLGDLAWTSGDFVAAAQYYSATSRERNKSWDRLIKLAFFRGDWQSVTDLVLAAPISPGFSPGHIILGINTSGGPYLRMVAAALVKSSVTVDSSICESISGKFGLAQAEIRRVIEAVSANLDQEIEKSRKACPPRIAKTPSLSMSVACERGNTPRARNVLEFFDEAKDLSVRAGDSLQRYLGTGEEAELQSFLEIILRPGVRSVSHSFLNHVMGQYARDTGGVPADRLIRLYSCHPIMDKNYFGRLLDLKFISETRLAARDVLTGIFQKLRSLSEGAILESFYAKRTLDFDKMVSCRDWAEIRLQDWLSGPGEAVERQVGQVWRSGVPEIVTGPFGGRKRRPDSPRSMAEWGRLVDAAHTWLEERWTEEIGISPWQSESLLLGMLKKAFKGYQVERHAQPIWLAPQHLDIFIPELSLGVEYMGQQHYGPVDFFGGSEGFAGTVERDKRKLEICRRAGIALEYVRYDEDMGKRVAEIKNAHAKRS